MAEDFFRDGGDRLQPTGTAVMLSMLAFYGIPAYTSGFNHARAQWPIALALGGMIVRVHHASLEEARELLTEVATRPPAMRPRFTAGPVERGIFYLLALFLFPLPTRASSTFFLTDPG